MLNRIISRHRLARLRGGARRRRHPLRLPGEGSVRDLRRIRRPRLPAHLHPRPVARHREAVREAPGALRHADRRQRAGRARHPRRHQLHRHAPEQALGPDGEQAVQPVGPDAERPAEARLAAEHHGVRGGNVVPDVQRQAERIHLHLEEGGGRLRRSRQEAGRRGRRADPAADDDAVQLQGTAASASRPTPSRTSRPRSSRSSRAGRRRSTSRRATARRTRPSASATATRRSPIR